MWHTLGNALESTIGQTKVKRPRSSPLRAVGRDEAPERNIARHDSLSQQHREWLPNRQPHFTRPKCLPPFPGALRSGTAAQDFLVRLRRLVFMSSRWHETRRRRILRGSRPTLSGAEHPPNFTALGMTAGDATGGSAVAWCAVGRAFHSRPQNDGSPPPTPHRHK